MYEIDDLSGSENSNFIFVLMLIEQNAQRIARRKAKRKEAGKERKVKLKTLHKMLGLVPYLDWTMIVVTTITTILQLCETHHLARTIPCDLSSIFSSPLAWCSSPLVFDLCDPKRGRVYLGSEDKSRPVDFVKFRIAL